MNAPGHGLAPDATWAKSPGGGYPAASMGCTSCHRAHGSSSPKAGRWDFKVTYLSQDGVRSGSYPLPNPYGSPTQRQLCEKCHYGD